MARSLPSNPSLEQLHKQARGLLKAHQAGEAETIGRIQESHPEYKNASASGIRRGSFSLRDAQLIIAREHNFENWSRLKEHLKWDLAVRHQDLKKMKALLEEKPGRVQQKVMVFRRNGSYWTMMPMHFANNNMAMMQLLLSYGAAPDTPGEPVLGAHSTPEFIDFALEHGADLENQYYKWLAAFHRGLCWERSGRPAIHSSRG